MFSLKKKKNHEYIKYLFYYKVTQGFLLHLSHFFEFFYIISVKVLSIVCCVKFQLFSQWKTLESIVRI